MEQTQARQSFDYKISAIYFDTRNNFNRSYPKFKSIVIWCSECNTVVKGNKFSSENNMDLGNISDKLSYIKRLLIA